jgi:excisionase family DNA binding protein
MAAEKEGLKEICTIAEVANYLRVHRSTITRYVMSGELPSYPLGRRRLFKREEVLSFFDNLKDRAGIAFSETED